MASKESLALGEGGASELLFSAEDGAEDTQTSPALQGISARIGVDARWPRLTARADRHLNEIEWRLARIGQEIRSGRTDLDPVAGRLRAAVVGAGLAKHGNWGKPKSPEHCARISAGLKGKPKSPEACARMAEAKRGTKRTPESVAKMVATRRANGSYAAQRKWR